MMNEVIDPRTSTTLISPTMGNKLDAGDRAKKSAGLDSNLLPVLEMTRVIIHDPLPDLTGRFLEANLNQVFGNVFDLPATDGSTISVLRVIVEEIGVLFHGRSTPGRIGDNRLNTGTLKGIDCGFRQLNSLSTFTIIKMESPTTGLPTWCDDLASVLRQKTQGPPVNMTKGHTHDTTGKKPNPMTMGANRRCDFIEGATHRPRRDRGREVVKMREGWGEEMGRAENGGESRDLVEPKTKGSETKKTRRRKEPVEGQ